MKYLKINYGNNKHNAIVKELLKKEDNLYMIYYDLTKHSEKASQLIIDNGNYLKDKDIEINIINNIKESCQILEPKILPKELTCTEKEIKISTKKDKQEKKLFIVYETELGTFLNCEICNKYNIGDQTKKQFIEGQFCYKTTKDEINDLEERTKNNNQSLKAFYKIIKINTPEYFTVYNINSELYVSKNLCDKYNITSNENKNIKGVNCLKVTKNDIEKIEKNKLKATYNRIFQIQRKKSFPVYKTKNGLYINKYIANKYNIDSNNNKYIEGYECIKVTEHDIEKIEIETKNNDPILKAKYYDLKLNNSDEFTVLVAKSGMYVEEDIINSLNIESKKTKTFNNKKYKLISNEIIEKIEKEKNSTAKYKEVPQKQSYFLVYNDDTNIYIDEYIANLFKLKTNKNIKNIENKNYIQIEKENINYIENITKNLDTKLNAKYVLLNKK